MKLEICSFSGFKIYPAKGKTYVRIDSRVRTLLLQLLFTIKKKKENRKKRITIREKTIIEKKRMKLFIIFWWHKTFRFINGKTESYFLQRLNPRKIRWTTIYRRLNKKGVTEEVAKKRSRRTVKHERAIAGTSWDAIRAKRNQKPDARAAARQAAIAKSKEAKKAKATQTAKKA